MQRSIFATKSSRRPHAAGKLGPVRHYIPMASVSPDIDALVRRLEDSLSDLGPALRSATDSSGGIKRADLVLAARPHLRKAGFSTSTEGSISMPVVGANDSVHFDAFCAGAAAALTLHAGRAWTNHEAIMSALRMAAANDVRVGILVVPDRYKGTPAAEPIEDFLRRLATWRGVVLQLDAVLVLGY